MSTLLRPELSKKNDLCIPKHRYYELKHFCLQYPDWKRAVSQKAYLKGNSIVKSAGLSQLEYLNPTLDIIESLDKYQRDIELVESCAVSVNPAFANYILEAVTLGSSWNYLKYAKEIPCGKNQFYRMYRLFFWYLDKLKA